jgi:uncharacterized protein (DUF433 family)
MKHALVTSDPRILMGKPVVTGTRITVELILEKLAADESIEQILEEHPRLTREAVLAALSFVAQGKQGEDRFDGLKASYSALAKDWDSPEEGTAWANL